MFETKTIKSDEFFLLLVCCTRSWHNSPKNICILTDEDEDDDYLLHLTRFTGPKGVAFQQ